MTSPKDPREIEEALHVLLESEPHPTPPPSPALEERLLARFDEAHPPTPRRSSMLLLKSSVFAALLILCLGAASQAPTSYPIEVGKSIDIAFAKGVEQPAPEALVEKLVAGRDLRVEARVQLTQDGGSSLHLALWGDTVPLTDIAATLRAAFPQLAGAKIDVAPVTGEVKTTLAKSLAHHLFDQANTPEQIEAARQRLIATLRAQGEKGKIDVEVDSSQEGVKKVKVRVTDDKREPAPAP